VEATSQDIVASAPNTMLGERRKEPEHHTAAQRTIESFWQHRHRTNFCLRHVWSEGKMVWDDLTFKRKGGGESREAPSQQWHL